MTKPNIENANRWVVRQRSSYGETRYYVCDSDKSSVADPLLMLHKKSWADGVVRELNRDPRIMPGARVRFVLGVDSLGASPRDELYAVTQDRYDAGDVGVLAFPHPNQAKDGCVGWWYVEVDSKIGEPRKLYVGVWPDGFEVVS